MNSRPSDMQATALLSKTARARTRSVYLDLERLLSSQGPRRNPAGIRPTWRTPDSVSCFSLFTMSIIRTGAPTKSCLIFRSDSHAHSQMCLTIQSCRSSLRGEWRSLSRRRRAIRGTKPSRRQNLVERIGIEPMTSCLQSTRSPS